MGVSARSIGEALAAAAGGAVRAAAATDAVDGVPAAWVAAPRSTEEVAAVVALAADEGLAVVPRGSGSALTLGHPPRRADVVLDLGRLARVIDYSPDDLTVTVTAGVSLGVLAAQLAPRGQWLPLDPRGGATRTLGGITATNAAGPLRARYGGLRDLLLGVRFVQADGVSTWGGARVVKSVTGYDVPKLHVGALGTLGVVTELTLRLHPIPAAEGAWLAAFPGAAAAQDFVAAVLDSTVEANRLEWLSAGAARALGLDPVSAGLAVGIGSVAAAVAEQATGVAALARKSGGTLAPAPPDLWSRLGALAPSPGALRLRVATVPAEVGATSDRVHESFAGGEVSVTGCAAVGALGADVGGVDSAGLARGVSGLREWLARLGGGVVIEAGPRSVRDAVDPWGPVAEGPLDLMRAIRDEFDPRRTLNPGRFVGRL